MVQPINLMLAHFNVEHTAQISRDALAAAQQTGQGKEVAEESIKRAQMVQAGIAAAETRKVKRKEEGEERENRRERQNQSFFGRSDSYGKNTEPESENIEEVKTKKAPKNFELYA